MIKHLMYKYLINIIYLKNTSMCPKITMKEIDIMLTLQISFHSLDQKCYFFLIFFTL